MKPAASLSSSEPPPYSESLFQTTFEHAAVGLSHGTLDFRFHRVNRKLADMLGYTNEELFSRSFDDLTHPEDRIQTVELRDKLWRGEIDEYSAEKRYRRKDQTYLWVRITVSLVRDLNQKPQYYVGIVEDIHERKDAEFALLKARQELEEERRKAVLERDKFFAIASDAMMIADGATEFFTRVNPAMCRALGFTEEELLSRPALDFIHPADHARARSLFPDFSELKGSSLPEQTFSNFEFRYLCKDGSYRTFSWNMTFVPRDQCIYGTGRDITKRLEHERVISLQKEQMAAASKMNALGRMAGGVAHEINNPLTIVYGQAFRLKRLAQEKVLDRAAITQISEQIEKMSARIVEIINGLRMFAREGSADPMEFVKLSDVLNDTLAFCQGKMRREDIELEIVNENKNLEICCRAVQISQVLLNILNNASDALLTCSRKKIQVNFIEQPELVGLAVQDSGPGVAPDVVNSLFQPFFTTKPVGKGTGLGLSVAKGIIDSHGGKIYYSDAPGGGATFTMLFPRVE